MKYIAIDQLQSIAKDITLKNGAKHTCIDATQIHELPSINIVMCKDCKNYNSLMEECRNGWMCAPDFYCGEAEPKGDDDDADTSD